MSFQQEQISWTPSIETGLSGDKYLAELIEPHVNGGPTEANAPGIYVLEHSTPDGGVDVHESLWAEVYDTVPRFITAIADAEKLVYVGAGENIYDRIRSHIDADADSNSLAEVFPVHGILNIELTDTADDAFSKEQQIMFAIRNRNPSWYVRSA